MTLLEAPGADAAASDPGRGGERPTPRDRPAGDWREVFATRLWPSALLYLTLATLAVLGNQPSLYVGDNRFEQYWNPGRRLARSFTIWDGSRGLGRVREDFWPGTTVPVALLRGLGLGPSMAEHLFHALCLALAATGMVAVVRLFRPRIGIEHTLAALTMAFGAYSATFLIPSNLYFNFALAPWFVVVAYRGIEGDRPWRWAAVFALLVLVAGNIDTPGLLYNLVPLIPLALFLVFIERSVRVRDVVGWVARAGVLAVAVNAVVLAKVYFAAGALGQRLNDTEAADVAALTSSWAESMRGLGNWLTYFPADTGAGLLKPQGTGYLSNTLVIVATFVPPCVALFALWRSRWRTRILFALTMLFSLVILVGAFPRANPSPLGRQILSAYTNIKLLTAFRNTYKIGAGLVIGVSALFAYGVMILHRSLRRRGVLPGRVPFAAAFLTIAVAGFPFWTGGLYNPTQRMDQVPSYWYDATGWLDALPQQGRSLVVPQTSRTQYRWGWVGDDIFDALLARPHAVATGVPLSTPTGANVLETLSVATAAPVYTPGVLGPMAKRLGITEIVVRNDLDWQTLDRPRPSAYDGLRHDPDFERVATFGSPGENTTDPLDRTRTAQDERTLPPVEVYRLRDATGPVRTVDAAAPLLVSGDGTSWPGLARAGLLRDGAPIAYTGQADAAQLRADLEHGAPVLITDGNRRRLRVLLSYEPDYSYLLAPGQDLDRPTQSLFKGDGTQSTAWTADAGVVEVSGPPRSIGGTQLWSRPANAFDGDESTAWRIRRIDRPFDHVMRVTFRQPTELRQASLTLPEGTAKGDGIVGGELRFSDGSRQDVDLSSGAATVTFPARTVDWVEFAPTRLGPTAQTLGLAEVRLSGSDPAQDKDLTQHLDLAEYVQVPDDVFRQAESDPALRDLIARAPTGYVFTRSVRLNEEVPPPALLSGSATTDEETDIRRRFRVEGTHELDVSGLLRLRTDVADRYTNLLVDQPVRVTASSRGSEGTSSWPGWTLDSARPLADGGAPMAMPTDKDRNKVPGDEVPHDDAVTGRSWIGPARTGTTLTYELGQPRRITDVTVGSFLGFGANALKKVSVYDGTGRKVGQANVSTQCPVDPTSTKEPPSQLLCRSEGAGVTVRTTIPLDPVPTTDRLTISLDEIEELPPGTSTGVRIDEVDLDGAGNHAVDLRSSLTSACLDLGLRVEEEPGRFRSVPVRVKGTVGQLMAGEPLPFEACAGVTLGTGWHRLATDPHTPFEQVQLVTPDLTARRAADPAASTVAATTVASPSSVDVHLDGAAPGTMVLLDESYDQGWQASVAGTGLGRARSLDGGNGWVLDGGAPPAATVELRYGPQRIFGVALAVTVAATALCLYLALRRPRRRPPVAPAPSGGGDGG